MAFNNYPYYGNMYGQSYTLNSPLSNQQSVQTQNVPQNNGGIIWVQGEAGAKSYLVAPNTTVQLWDSESQRIYLKSTDASGLPSMKILEYTVLDNVVKSNTDKIEYATKDDINNINLKLAEFENKIKELFD